MSDTTERVPDTPGARQSYSRIPDQGHNYVLNGLDMAVIDGALTVSSGTLVVLDDAAGEVVLVDVDARYGPSAVSLPASGTAGVYYDVGALEIVVGSDPGGLRLQLGSVDVDAGTTAAANTDPDAKYGSLDTEIQPYSISPSSFSEINNAISGDSDVWVKIKPGTELSDNTQITIDPLDSSNDGRSIVLDFRRAKLKVTDDSATSTIEILSNFDSGTPQDSDVTLIIGDLIGPGNSTDISAIRGVDVLNTTVDIGTKISSFGRGVHLRNESKFSENWTISGNGAVEDCARPLKMEGATETGGSGTDSMMGFYSTVRYETSDSTSGDVTPPIGIDMRSVNLKESYIFTKIFTNQGDATGVRYDNSGSGGVFIFNIDGSSSGETGIDVQENALHEYCSVTSSGLSTVVETNSNFAFPHWREGMRFYNANTKIFETRRGWLMFPERSSQPADWALNDGQATIWPNDGNANIGEQGSIITSVERSSGGIDMMMTNYRGEVTGTPADVVAGDAWLRTDQSPSELRIHGEDGIIRHFEVDGTS